MPKLRRVVNCVALTFAIAAAASLPTLARGQAAVPDPVLSAAIRLADAVLRREVDSLHLVGLSVAVVSDQQVVWARGFGYANRERLIPASPETMYRAASMTKAFTATMLVQLRDAGQLRLDDTVQRFLPGVRIASRFEDTPPMTLRQLASHSSGIQREPPRIQEYWDRLVFPPMDSVLVTLGDAEMAFRPLTRFDYSNLGYAILGRALETAAGESYAAYVERNILAPLGMANSMFAVPPGLEGRTAVGYGKPVSGHAPLQPLVYRDFGALTPAGGLWTSAADMARFVALQFRKGQAGGDQILRGSSLREMRTPQWMNPDWSSGWGLGFSLDRTGGRLIVSHGGDAPGYDSAVLFIPDLQLGIVILTNTDTDSDPDRIGRELLELFIPPIADQRARAAAPTPPASPDWNSLVGRYRSEVLALGIDIRIVNGRLVAAWVEYPGATPARLDPIAPLVFRMDGGHSPGERLVFSVDSGGRAVSFREGGYVFRRAGVGRNQN